VIIGAGVGRLWIATASVRVTRSQFVHKHRTWRMFKDPIFWHPNFTFGTWPKIPYDSINKFGISYSLLQFVLAAAGLRSLQK